MNPRRKKRLTIVIAVLIGLSVVTSLILYAFNQNIQLFFTPDEIVQGKKDSGLKPKIGQRIRIGGLVVPGSVERNDVDLKVSFDLVRMQTPMSFAPEEIRVTVKYDGILPDLFREGQGIVANGTLVSNSAIDGYIIEASEVLAKHDENYMPKELADSAKEKHGGQAAY